MEQNLILNSNEYRIIGNYLVIHSKKMIYQLDDEDLDKIIENVKQLNQ